MATHSFSLTSDQTSLAALAAQSRSLLLTLFTHFKGLMPLGPCVTHQKELFDCTLDLIQASPTLCSETPEDDSSEPLSNEYVPPS